MSWTLPCRVVTGASVLLCAGCRVSWTLPWRAVTGPHSILLWGVSTSQSSQLNRSLPGQRFCTNTLGSRYRYVLYLAESQCLWSGLKGFKGRQCLNYSLFLPSVNHFHEVGVFGVMVSISLPPNLTLPNFYFINNNVQGSDFRIFMR